MHCMQVENGKLRPYSPAAYTSWGSPKPITSAVGRCGPGSELHGCQAGAPMPINPVKPCSGATQTTPCGSLSSDPTKCCACRKTKADGSVAVYASAAASTAYNSAPDCSKQLALLPANTQVAYTGAKLLGYTGNGCTAPADYAQVVVQVGWFCILG